MRLVQAIFLLLFCWYISLGAYAQIGGRNAFIFAQLPTHARQAALGGLNISLAPTEPTAWWQNPALLTDTLHGWAAWNHSRWHADIAHYTLSYVRKHPRRGAWGLGAQVVNYGTLTLTDESGAELGTFRATDFALQAGYAWQQDYFRFGITARWLGSQIESYQAHALAVDMGAYFKHPHQDLSLGFVIQNLGFRVQNYLSGEPSPLPFNIAAGLSFKPEYMPFRFSVTAQHLYKWDIVYLDPSQSTQLDISGKPIPPSKSWLDQLFRHVIFGGEILLHRNFQVRLGYNHLINREFQIRDLGGTRGFSFGFNFQTRLYAFGYAYGTYMRGAGRSFFTLAANTTALAQKIRRKPSY